MVCLRATNFDIKFSSQITVSRIDWQPLFAPCQPCASEWSNRAAFIDTHEQKHAVDIHKALQEADSQWPRSRNFQTCGTNEGQVGYQLMQAIAAGLQRTWTQLTDRIKKDGATLDAQEPYSPMDCTLCRCQVSAECKVVTVTPSSVGGGATSSGSVTLLTPAPSPGGADVLLKSDDLAASVPSQINVPAGGTTGIFGISTVPVQDVRYPFIYASRPGGGTICSAQLSVWPPRLVDLMIPAIINRGDTERGTITLDSVAPAQGIPVQLAPSSYLQVPSIVTVPAGASQTNFDIIAGDPPSPSTQTLTAEWYGTKLHAQTFIP
jgi:hypothetical protein